MDDVRICVGVCGDGSRTFSIFVFFFFFAPFVLTDGRDGGDDLSQLELVEDGGFTSCVESHHEDAHLFLGEEPCEDPADGEPHGVGGTRGLIQTSVDSWPNV